MKKLILLLAVTFCFSAFSAGPIVIYGRAYIQGQKVWCGGGSKLCAVIPQKEDGGPLPSDGVITIYNEDGSVMEQHSYSAIQIEEDNGGTLVSWIP